MIPEGEEVPTRHAAASDDQLVSSDGENRLDSGVSTMNSSASRSSFSGLLEANNNMLSDPIDVVSLLHLRSTDDEDAQVSNSSSLESLTSLDNNQGSGGEDDDGEESGSTSCSEDSFEMSSTCGMETSPDASPLRTTAKEEAEASNMSSQNVFRPPQSSISMDSFMTNKLNEAIRRNIDYELSTLDTGLPQLDFDKLERQLVTAAREREEQERRLLGEEVRRRLALQVDSTSGPMPPVNTRPHRSNLAVRLQTAMNLQVCYMNELAESGADSEDDSDDDGFLLSKSKSVPNLEKHCQPGPSRCDEVIRLRKKAKDKIMLDPYERHRLLTEETKCVLAKAKIEGQKKIDEFRRTKSRASVVPRQSRQQLSKMTAKDVRRIRDTMENAINQKNKELVQLLMDRDGLHMEHDSLLVDIEDFTEHETQATALDFAQLLAMQDGEIPSVKTRPTLTSTAFPGSKVVAPTPTPTPTSPSRSFALPQIPHLPHLPQLPKSLSSFFRR